MLPLAALRSIPLAIALAELLALYPVEAGNTWDGNGGDDNWGTGANWNPDGSPAPGSGNDLFFGGSTRLSPFNNYTAFDDWRNITFNVGAGSFNLFGNAIDLFGKIENLSSNSQSVSLTSIALNSATANEFNPVNGNLTILSTNIFTNGNQLKVFGNNGFTLSFGSGTNIQQGGSLAINQNSTVIFNSAHSYTGDTFINAGKLQFASGGSANSSVIRIGDTAGTAGAEFDLTVSTGGQSVGNTIVSRLGGAGYAARVIDSQNTSGINALTGVIALDAALTLKQAAGGTLNLTGSFVDVKQQVLTVDAAGTVDISKPLDSSFAAGGSLVKQGNGTLTLSNTSNNYTGTNSATLNASGTQIAAGTLAIAADTSLGLAPAGAYNNIQFTGSSTLQANAAISLHANRNISIASGVTASFNSNGNTFTINGIVNGSSGNVEKSGNGTVILTGTNTYTGTTTVSAGTLAISGTGSINSTSAINVSAGATFAYNSSTALTVVPTLNGTGTGSGQRAVLSGTGPINIGVTLDNVGDVLSPGNSPGIMTFQTGQTWLSNSYDWEINDWAASVVGTDIDQIQITGGLDLSAVTANSYLLNILSLVDPANTSGNVGNFTETPNSWSILTTTAGITGFNASEWQINATGFTNNETGTWSVGLGNSNKDLVLTYAPIPEPRAALLGGLGLLLLLRRRRD